MPSIALHDGRTSRSDRLTRLQAAHATIGGTGPGRRWLTEELNHALILRLAAEFQGLARDSHEDAAEAIAASLSAGVLPREEALQGAFRTGCARWSGRDDRAPRRELTGPAGVA